MPKVVIISASVREGRKSHRVALYFRNYITQHELAEVEILDLKEYQFQLFNERLSLQKNPSAGAIHFAEKISAADGVIIVTPEYNGGYPASLKNVTDLLYKEWYRKPVAISTASGGPFGGAQVITSIQFSLWKIRAWTVPALFPVPMVQDAFDEQGNPADRVQTDKRARIFLDEFFWCVEARHRMEQ